MAAIVVALLARRSALVSPANFFSKSHFCACASSCLSHLFSTSTNSIINPPQDFFIDKYHFSPQIAAKAASISARTRNPLNPDVVLSFLQQKGFSNKHLERIIKHHPMLLSLCIETNVKPKFKIFQDLGFSDNEVNEVIARDLSILRRAADTINLRLSMLRRLLESNDNLIKLIKKCGGNLFYADPDKTILPNIEFLKSCGVSIEQINTFLYSQPAFFLINPENMRRCVDKADEMGVDRSSRMFIHAVGAVCHMSDETLELKLKSFRDMGFSEEDILRVFRSAPVVFALSTHKIKEVKEVLLQTGKYDTSCIVKYPLSLAYNVEKRYKPRLHVLKALERSCVIDKWPTLPTLCLISNKSFYEKFVAPNMNEVGEDFLAMTADSDNLGIETKL